MPDVLSDLAVQDLIRLIIANQASTRGPAFQELHRRYRVYVRNRIRGSIPDSDIDDASQEVWVRIYTGLASLTKPESIAGWIAVIAARVCSNWDKDHFFLSSLDKLLSNGSEPAAPPMVLWPDDDAEATFEANAEAMINLLPAGQLRQALHFRVIKKLSYIEICQSLRVPLNTVRTLLKVGRDLLKSKLREGNGL